MYVPAFLEIFLGLTAVVVWSSWLKRKPAPTAVVRALPWVAGSAVMIGQIVATWAILNQVGGMPDHASVRLARWGSFGVVGGCLLVELGLTVWVLVRARGP
jgi:hypothetical protein